MRQQKRPIYMYIFSEKAAYCCKSLTCTLLIGKNCNSPGSFGRLQEYFQNLIMNIFRMEDGLNHQWPEPRTPVKTTDIMDPQLFCLRQGRAEYLFLRARSETKFSCQIVRGMMALIGTLPLSDRACLDCSHLYSSYYSCTVFCRHSDHPGQ